MPALEPEGWGRPSDSFFFEGRERAALAPFQEGEGEGVFLLTSEIQEVPELVAGTCSGGPRAGGGHMLRGSQSWWRACAQGVTELVAGMSSGGHRAGDGHVLRGSQSWWWACAQGVTELVVGTSSGGHRAGGGASHKEWNLLIVQTSVESGLLEFCCAHLI